PELAASDAPTEESLQASPELQEEVPSVAPPAVVKTTARDAEYRNVRSDLERAIRKGDWNAAVAAGDELFILSTTVDWEAHLWVAKTHRRLGHSQRAAELFEDFAQRFTANRHRAKSAYIAGVLFTELGELGAAASNFNTVLDGPKPAFKRKARAALKKLEADLVSEGEQE
ncbi:MAG: hypothetical protein AAF658_09000, partial [Myxococcota bacterium]